MLETGSDEARLILNAIGRSMFCNTSGIDLGGVRTRSPATVFSNAPGSPEYALRHCSQCASYHCLQDDRFHGRCGNSKAQKWADYVQGTYTGTHITRWNDTCRSFRRHKKKARGIEDEER